MRGIRVVSVSALVVLAALGAKPAGAATESGYPPVDPVCDQRHLVNGAVSGRPATLVWGQAGGVARRVTVLFDAAGAPIQYSDMETAGGFQDWMPYRFVHLDFETDQALVQVQTADGRRIDEQFAIGDVLTSAALGMPSETIRRVRSTCTDL